MEESTRHWFIDYFLHSAYSADKSLTQRSLPSLVKIANTMLDCMGDMVDQTPCRDNTIQFILNVLAKKGVGFGVLTGLAHKWYNEPIGHAPDLSQAALIVQDAIVFTHGNRILADGIMFNILQAKPKTLWDLLCVFPFALTPPHSRGGFLM